MMSEKAGIRSLVLVAVLFVATVLLPASDATAEHAGEAAERAAREILDARDRANAAAQALFDAESRLDSLTIELAAAESELAEMEAEVAELRRGLTAKAIRQFVGADESSLMLFRDIGTSNTQAAALVYAGAVTESELVQADDFDVAIHELDEARQALDAQRQETIAAREDWADLRVAAEEQVIELQRIEEERLADALVQHELERQRQARAEQERLEREREAQRQAAAAAAAAASAASGSSGARGNDRASSGSSGGSSNATPTPPPPSPPPPAPRTGMACPVAGPRSFADTWGAPRSGGRSHQGVDMMAPQGTPLVAVESGSANFKTNRLGGNAVWLTGSSGTKYYYAHLSAWEGSSRSVSRGEVIGYVGSTGNTSVAHLHFEVHPGGAGAVNPYPYVRAVC